MANIGFIGLGHMGLPMALNLLKAGHRVVGFDLQSGPVETLIQEGGVGAKKALDAVIGQEVLITMLQTGKQVESIVLGEQGAYFSLAKNALHIDCSTIDVASARKMHHHAETQDLLSVDAPVSGGVAGAKAGTLTFMVGGKEAAVALASSILKTMGETIIATGAEGSGQAAKICNNLILGISMIGVSEAFILAEKLGLSPQKLHEVVTHASGQCWVMSKYPPIAGILDNVPANHDYQAGFAVAMMLKDLCLSQQEAAHAGLDLPMSAKARELYRHFADQGFAGLDFSAIINVLH